MKYPIRVLHCPTMVGGNPQSLARAERTIGLASWSIALERSVMDYAGDESYNGKGIHRLFIELIRWPLVMRALLKYDIIHFNAGHSLMPYWLNPVILKQPIGTYIFNLIWQTYKRFFQLLDVPLLHAARKGIVVTYQGDDARQADFCRKNFPITFVDDVDGTYFPTNSDAAKRARIAKFEQYADRIYALNPDLLHVLPQKARFMPYASVDPRDWSCSPPRLAPGDTPVIVHAPSHRQVKGTKYLLKAIERLKAEGIRCEFRLVEGMSFAEARDVYSTAHLAVDQLLAGWYGSFAVELMAMGKPVVCYIREGDLRFIPEGMRRDLPILQATPDTIYQVLKTCLTTRRHELTTIGQACRTYVERWHDPQKIALELKQEYEAIMREKLGGMS